MRKPLLIFCCFAMCACASVPKPPTVNGKHRSQINDTETTELLKLRAESAEWHNTGTVPATPAPAPTPAVTTPVVVHRSPSSQTPDPLVYVVHHFAYGATAFEVPADLRSKLLPLARTAARIDVRGRTDGQHFSIGDEQVAFHRALAVREFLIRNGVAAQKINVNYVSGGDYVADNDSASGRTQNRRVEIAVFSASLN